MSLLPAEASARILQGIAPLPRRMVPLGESEGRVLAVDVMSPVVLPPWDNAAMDGYAVRGADVIGAAATAPRRLRIVGTIAAGSLPSRVLSPGETMRIMTGAPVPEGADSVVRIEDSDGATDGEVEIRDDRDVGKNVRPRGEDAQAGTVALPAGTYVGPPQLAFLATVGAAAVEVHRPPRVAILSTGNEIVPLAEFDQVREGHRVVDANGWSLAAMSRACGAEVISLGIARDEPEEIARRLRDAAGRADLVITSGGVSMGAFDHLRGAVEVAGGSLDFFRVRIRPGGPLSFGHLGKTPWLGLPGNPVSAMVTFELFARPLILRLGGHRRTFRRPVQVCLEEPVTIAAPLTHFLRATLRCGADGMLHGRLTGPQGSGLVHSMARADALLVIPPDRMELKAGDIVNALLINDGPMLESMSL